MPSKILSICIPTYNRPERIKTLVNQIIKLESDEIEIVIGDDNPTIKDNEDLIKNINDSRFIYYHNKQNLGQDKNILKLIFNASGEYIFLLVDEDDIELENLPWILEKLKENKKITYLRGTLGDRRLNRDRPYYEFKNCYLQKGDRAIEKMLFYNMHGSGMIFKRNIIDFYEASKNIGSLIIQDNLTAQVIKSGDILCTSRTLAYIGRKEYPSAQPKIKKKDWLHPLTALNTTIYRVNIILDFSNPILKKRLLDKQEFNIFLYLCHIYSYNSYDMKSSLIDFIKGFFIIFKIKKIRFSLRFWIKLAYRFILTKLR